MDTALWIVQGFLALVMATAGTAKTVLPREKLATRMHWAASWPRWRIKLLGVAELAGAIGLIAPAATGIAPALTSIAALCLAVLMAGAVHTHQRLKKSFVAPMVIGVLCVVTAIGRWPGANVAAQLWSAARF